MTRRYVDALRIVSAFTEGLTTTNAEYERGQLELLADMFPRAGVETSLRMEEIAADIRALPALFQSEPCTHDDLVGYWRVQVSGDITPERELDGDLDTEMSDIYGQVHESEPVEVACRNCDAIISARP